MVERNKCGECLYCQAQNEEVGICNYDIPQVATINKPGANKFQQDQTQVEAVLPPVRLDKVGCHHFHGAGVYAPGPYMSKNDVGVDHSGSGSVSSKDALDILEDDESINVIARGSTGSVDGVLLTQPSTSGKDD
jgi:hypothetical protein